MSTIHSVNHNLQELIATSREISWTTLGKKIAFYAPSFTQYENIHFQSSSTCFPSISITGGACSLKCKHCYGRVLNTMISATTPQKLVEICRRLKERGSQGCLISGGCLPDGSVPLPKYLGAIKQIKEELDLTVIVHTGIINQAVARGLADTGIDAALIDIIGAQETIEDIYNLNIQVIDYQRSLQALSEAGISFIPHVIVGLHHGKLLGEVNALEMIAKYTPDGLVIIALIPLPGTPMQQVSPPRVEDIIQVIARARVMMPSIPIALGCMRPKGRHRRRTDVLAVKAGVSAIAYPVKEAVDLAKSYGLQIHFSPLCCSQMYDDFRRIS